MKDFYSICFDEACIKNNKQLINMSHDNTEHSGQFLHLHPGNLKERLTLLNDKEIRQTDQTLKLTMAEMQTNLEKKTTQTLKLINNFAEQTQKRCSELLNLFSSEQSVELTRSLIKPHSSLGVDALKIINQAWNTTDSLSECITSLILEKRIHPFAQIYASFNQALQNLREGITVIGHKQQALPSRSNLAEHEAQVSENNSILQQSIYDRQSDVFRQHSVNTPPISVIELDEGTEMSLTPNSRSHVHEVKDSYTESDQIVVRVSNSQEGKSSHSLPQGLYPFQGHKEDSIQKSGKKSPASSQRISLCKKSSKKPLPKKHQIEKKTGKRGRPRSKPRLCPQHASVAMYAHDMAIHFPRQKTVEGYTSLTTQLASSPLDLASVSLRSQSDIQHFQELDERVIGNIEELIIGKIDKHESYIMPFDNIIARLEQPQRIARIHLKYQAMVGVSQLQLTQLVTQCQATLKQFIYEDCSQISAPVLDALARCPNLIGLKLQGNYLHHFKLRSDLLFQFIGLKYLSLSSAKFTDEDGDDHIGQTWMQGLQNLKSLVYLSFYDCIEVKSELLGYLDPEVYKNLFHLVLGLSQVDSGAVRYLANFESLRQLSLESTPIGGEDLVELGSTMRCRAALQELSVRYMDGKPWLHGKKMVQNGRIDNIHFQRITKYFPSIEYLNVAEISKDKELFNFTRFKRLKQITLSKLQHQYFAHILKAARPDIKCYTDQGEPTLIEPPKPNKINVDQEDMFFKESPKVRPKSGVFGTRLKKEEEEDLSPFTHELTSDNK